MSFFSNRTKPSLACFLGKFIVWAILGLGLPSSIFAQHFDWGSALGSTSYSLVVDFATDQHGSAITIGFMYPGTADFDPGPGTFTITAPSSSGAYFVQKLDSAGNFLWAIGYFGSGIDISLKAVETDQFGNVFLIGNWYGGFDFDPGPGTYNAWGGGETFVLKLGPQGDFMWLRNFAFGFGGIVKAAATDNANNLLLTGHFTGFGDFNPSNPGQDTLTAADSTDAFVLKLDPAGNTLWARRFGKSGGEAGIAIVCDDLGNVYSMGQFLDSTDMDPGVGTATFAPISYTNYYISKLDPAGNYVWSHMIPNGYYSDYVGFTLAPNGDCYVGGSFYGTVDFDIGPGVQSFTSNNADIFLQKLNASGNLVWAKQLEGTGDETCQSLKIGSDGNLYTIGTYAGLLDLDPGPGIHQLNSNYINIFTCKQDTSATPIWSFELGCTGGGGNAGRLELGPHDEILIAGDHGCAIDFDPGPNVVLSVPGSGLDVFVAKYTQDSCANFRLSVDSTTSLNCANQTATAWATVLGGTTPYVYAWNTTPVQTTPSAQFTAPGIYTLNVTDSLSCSRSVSVLINGPASFSGYDLQASLVHTTLRVGDTTTFWPMAHNAGCTTMNGQLSLVLDSNLVFLSAIPAPTAVVGDTLTWNFSGLDYGSADFVPVVQVEIPVNVPINQSLCFSVIASPILGDNNPADNVQSGICDITRGSYDPNDITAYPGGECDEHYVLLNTPLQYKIRFQNTGNAEAFEVSILDTLDPNLDLSSMVVRNTSHTMVTEVLPGNIVKFNFHNINLPDSTTDEPNSHGYVVYDIQMLSGIATGNTISNRAAIYFDFNPPVITNTASILLVDSIPPCSTVAEHPKLLQAKISLYPNPATESVMLRSSEKLDAVYLVNTLGKRQLVADHIEANRFELELREFDAGIYFVEIYYEGGKQMKKLVIQ